MTRLRAGANRRRNPQANEPAWELAPNAPCEVPVAFVAFTQFASEERQSEGTIVSYIAYR
jgi:hypothetical protein